jgi:hypothetical protein
MLEHPMSDSYLQVITERQTDYQQVKEAWIWLAGFYDGEGHIGLTKNTSKGYIRYSPMVDLVNTNIEVMEEIAEFYTQQGIGHYVWNTKHQGSMKNGRHHKQRRTIRIGTMKAVKVFLDGISPYLRVKWQQAELLYQFVNTRATGYTLVTDLDHRIYDELKALNQKGTLLLNPQRLQAGTSKDV